MQDNLYIKNPFNVKSKLDLDMYLNRQAYELPDLYTEKKEEAILD
jgi:hypothetical protein